MGDIKKSILRHTYSTHAFDKLKTMRKKRPEKNGDTGFEDRFEVRC